MELYVRRLVTFSHAFSSFYFFKYFTAFYVNITYVHINENIISLIIENIFSCHNWSK